MRRDDKDPSEFGELVAQMREMGWETNSPMRFIHTFGAWERTHLDALIPKLQALGYVEAEIEGSEASCFYLTVKIVAPLTADRLGAQQDFHHLVFRDGEGQPWFRSTRIEPRDKST
jgi:hypothetical protein